MINFYNCMINRAVSVILAISLILSLICGIPAASAAGDAPVSAKPITEYTPWRIGFTGRSCYPIDGVEVSGEQVDAVLLWDTAETEISDQSNHVMVYNKMSESLCDTYGALIYISVPAANTVVPTFILAMPESSRWSKSYAPEMTLKVGNTFSVLENGSDNWESKTAVKAKTNSSTGGGIRFDKAFEGYIKIPYASLANSSNFKIDSQLDAVTSVAFRFKSAGGEYGQITAGPLFWITGDSNSTDIVFPQEYYEKQKISAAAVTQFTKNAPGFSSAEEACNDEIPVNGWRFSNSESYECEQLKVSSQNKRLFYMDRMNLPSENARGILLYIQTQTANILAPTLTLEKPSDFARWKYSWPPELSLYVGESFEYFEDGTAEWKSGTIVAAHTVTDGSVNAYKGGISLNKAFSGYIRIPFSAFKNDSGFKPDFSVDIINNFAVRFQRSGGDFGDILMSPLMLDMGGESAEFDIKPFIGIEIPESIENGSITVSKNIAVPGQTVIITVNPNDGYALKADGLKACYSDFSGSHNIPVFKRADEAGKEFSFVLPQTDSITINAEFVAKTILNFASLEPSAEENGIRFVTRIYENGTGYKRAGLLLTQQRLLENRSLTHNISEIQVLDIPFTEVYDENAPADESGAKYRDYSVILENILSENKDRTYAARAYIQSEDGSYEYADQCSANLSELLSGDPFADKLYRTDYSDTLASDCTTYRMQLGYEQTAYPYLFSGRKIKAQVKSGSCDYSAADTDKSVYWYKSAYNGLALKGITHLMFYVSVPDTKENYLYLTFGSERDTSEYSLTSAKSYQLLKYGENRWQHFKTVRGSTVQRGVITLPAGFEGFVKIPVSSITPAVTDSIILKNTTFRFSYIGGENQAVYTGPLIGIRHDTDKDEREITLAELPAATTALTVESPEQGDIGNNYAFLYWQPCESASYYSISAYRISENGYVLEKTAAFYQNSGAVTGLTPDTNYAFVVSALNSGGETVAVYPYKEMRTLTENPFSEIAESGNIIYDSAAETPEISRSYTALSANNSALLSSNPNKGFRGVIEFYHYNISESEIRSTIDAGIRKVNRYHSTDTYVVYFYLGDYADCALDIDALNAISTALEYFRQKKTQILLRFAYTDYHVFNNISGPVTETILGHISQLGPLVRRYSDIYHAVQAGFVGYFGEWHGDKQNVDRASILNSFMQLLCPENSYAQVRRPIFKDLIDDSSAYKKRVGFHIDSYFGIMDATELGSSGYSYGLPEWNTQVNSGSYTPNDAELYWFTQFKDSGIYAEGYASLLGASQLHLTTLSAVNGYLDQGPDTDGCMVRWKSIPVTEKWLSRNGIPYSPAWFKNSDGGLVSRSVFDFITDYLGYRLSAESFETNISGNRLNLSLKLKNLGTSSAFNLTGRMVLLDESGNEMQSFATDNPSVWYPRNPNDYSDTAFPAYTVSGGFDMPSESGTYKIALKLCNGVGSSARLDNNIPYENGYNIIHTFKL